ncbi:NmrA/HSCARG family protein [Glaciihabitans sp. UYNi722]|uniref:NmrA/HSCARG family protein n=1 Tax=Glaciihabitans sp. UYNi722 TaxID=3156344 RepID=UPI003394EEEF
MTEKTAPAYAVIGATGQQGGAVVDALLDRGANVRAIVRDPESDRSRALAARGVSLVHGDLDEVDSIASALADVSGLFLMTTYDESSGGTDGEIVRGRAIADAAQHAKVPRVVYSSVGGAERNSGVPHFESKRLVEKALTDVVPVSFVRPTFFLENLARSLAPSGDTEFVLRLPMPGNVPLQMVSVRDIGIVAAEVLLNPALLPDGAIEIAGDELTGEAIAQRIGEHLGKPGQFQSVPLSVFGADTDRQAMFRWFVDTPAYQANFTATKRIDPDVLDLVAWLRLN